MAVLIGFGYLPEGFSGFARQPEGRTVEGEILRVLIDTGAVESGAEARLLSSSRTDRGVGALLNYASFWSGLPVPELIRRLNPMIDGCFFYKGCTVDDSFDPRTALYREYVYYLYPETVGGDIKVFGEAILLFRGTHVFHSFSKRDRSRDDEFTRCPRAVSEIDVNTQIIGEEVILRLTFKARSFLYGQIRKMVAAAAMAARGKIEKDDIIDALASGTDRGRFPSHPPEGLYLLRVGLPEEVEGRLKWYPAETERLRGMMRTLELQRSMMRDMMVALVEADRAASRKSEKGIGIE